MTRRQVVEVQQARLVSSAIDALAERGYEGLTVAAVIERAHVSRKTFYEIFDNRDECFQAVFEHISARGLSVLRPESAEHRGWLPETRSGLHGLLSLIDEDPLLARIWFVESLAGPTTVLRRRAQLMSAMVDAIHRGGAVARDGREPSRLVAEATVGGVWHVVHARLVAESTEPYIDLAAPLMYMIVLPYLGHRRAEAELRRAPTRMSPRRSPAERTSLDESLRGLEIRLTYRTVRAITAVFEHPGASNLQVSVDCGIKDQGQISKLLSRLEGLGLVVNHGLGRDLGAPNSWHITDRGSDLVRATRLLDADLAPRHWPSAVAAATAPRPARRSASS